MAILSSTPHNSAELALVRERIAWTRRQLCRVDERIAILTEELWMTLNEEHYSTVKRMISASSRSTFNKARSTQMAIFTKLTSYGQKNRRKQEEDLASHPLRQWSSHPLRQWSLTEVQEILRQLKNMSWLLA